MLNVDFGIGFLTAKPKGGQSILDVGVGGLFSLFGGGDDSTDFGDVPVTGDVFESFFGEDLTDDFQGEVDPDFDIGD